MLSRPKQIRCLDVQYSPPMFSPSDNWNQTIRNTFFVPEMFGLRTFRPSLGADGHIVTCDN